MPGWIGIMIIFLELLGIIVWEICELYKIYKKNKKG